MPILQANPYLNFNGDASQAIELYQSALGATVESIFRFGDSPGGENMPPALKNRVMHATLRVAGTPIMVSDAQPDQKVAGGSNTHISLSWDSDTASMKKAFDALAAGGTVTMAIHDAFWGAKFGMLVDRFGVSWMFNSEHKK